jgi:hypothetical protein
MASCHVLGDVADQMPLKARQLGLRDRGLPAEPVASVGEGSRDGLLQGRLARMIMGLFSRGGAQDAGLRTVPWTGRDGRGRDGYVLTPGRLLGRVEENVEVGTPR